MIFSMRRIYQIVNTNQKIFEDLWKKNDTYLLVYTWFDGQWCKEKLHVYINIELKEGKTLKNL